MSELKFSSSDEAIQYLSDYTQSRVVVAGLWTDVWTRMAWPATLTKRIEKEYLIIKRMVARVTDEFKAIKIKNNRTNKTESINKFLESLTIYPEFNSLVKKLNSNKTVNNLKAFFKATEGFLKNPPTNSEELKKILIEDADERGINEVKEAFTMAKIQLAKVEEKKRELIAAAKETFQKERTQKNEDSLEKAVQSINKAISEEISKILNVMFQTSLSKAIKSSIEFEDESQAIQHLSDLTSKKIIIL